MWRPIRRSDWDVEKAAHLLARTGFGPTNAEIEAAAARAPEEVVAELLDFEHTPDPWEDPAWAVTEDASVRPGTRLHLEGLSYEEQMKQVHPMERAEVEHVHELRAWWLARMRATKRPLQEKLVLFWHGHWTTSAKKVLAAYALWLQNCTLRRFAAGNFKEMTHALTQDPAMMYFLDVNRNRAKAPNENFARELMELYTLGIGRYSEDDVVASARAFTGWRVDLKRIAFREVPSERDNGDKVFMGRKGAFTPREIVDIIFEHPAMGVHLVRKLWAFFAYEEPESALVDELAASFRASGFELKPLLARMFQSEAFYSPRALHTQIKSPVQWLVGTTRAFEAPLPDADTCAWMLRVLGQELFEPPSVAGWDGDRAWITAHTLLSRYNFAGLLIKGGKLLAETFPELLEKAPAEKPGEKDARAENHAGRVGFTMPRIQPLVDGQRLLPADQRASRQSALAFLAWRLFRAQLPAAEEATLLECVSALPEPAEWSDEDVRTLVHALMSTPSFQLT